MKTLRQLLVALVFTLALAIPALAGEMETGRTTPPPTPTATTAGEMQTTVTGQEEANSSEATATDSATEFALNLLQSVLSLF
jgi:hypothetical protein